MAEILIHSEPISDRMRKRLLDAGIIPIRAKDTSSVRLIAPEPSLMSSDVILASALAAMSSKNKSGFDRNQDDINRTFVKSIAEAAGKALTERTKAYDVGDWKLETPKAGE